MAEDITIDGQPVAQCHCSVCEDPVSTFIQIWTPSIMDGFRDSVALCDRCVLRISHLAAQERGGGFETGPSRVRRFWRKKDI
jgi:hypothetical protein